MCIAVLPAREVVPWPHTNNVLLGVGGTTNLLLAVGDAGNVLLSRAGLTNLTITNYSGTNLIITNKTFDIPGLIWTNLPRFTTNNLQGVAARSSLFVLTGDRAPANDQVALRCNNLERATRAHGH